MEWFAFWLGMAIGVGVGMFISAMFGANDG